jgi:hypothetical protein
MHTSATLSCFGDTRPTDLHLLSLEGVSVPSGVFVLQPMQPQAAVCAYSW